jgi:ABC-2 type transport system ATP-binding protein
VAIVEVSHLHRRYGATVAVEDVSFTVVEGEIFGLLGPNGAGKTTTVESIVGLRVPDAGTIRVLGLDPLVDHAKLRERVGVQLQESAQPPKLRAEEALLLYASFYRHPDDPERLLETLGLSDKRESFFRDLSGGQKQRLSIALALIGRPTIAVLDELTTGLDPQARRDTWDLVKAVRDQGVTTVLVTHDMEEAQHLCDRVALVDAGRIVAIDTPARLAE